VFTEEAYTSQSSFLDCDPLSAYEKGVKHEFSGNRKHRGLYISSDKYALNADVNGSLNIGRKVVPEFSLGIGDRSLAARPVRIDPTKIRCV
jgi:putative transposase